MLPSDFAQQFQIKVNAFARFVYSTIELSGLGDQQPDMIMEAYGELGKFLYAALGEPEAPKESSATGKTEGAGVETSSWASIRPANRSGLSFGDGGVKGDGGDAWASIERRSQPALIVDADVKDDRDTGSSWDSIRLNNNSGLEIS